MRRLRRKTSATLKKELGLADHPVVLYTGTFEAYQGFGLLIDAFVHVARHEPQARLLLVGGHPEQVREVKELTRRKGIQDQVVFTGQRPPSEMPLYLAAGDILVSPRSRGKNTPLKIYSYLRSGKPIVATRLLTHTQVLDDDIALLTDAEPEPFAEGIVALLHDPETAARLGESARCRAEEKYSYEKYLEKTRRLFDFLENQAPKVGD